MKLFVVVAVCFCFEAGGGPVSFRAVKGEGGPVSFCFCFGAGGGPVSFRAVKGEGGPVSFGVGCETVRRRRRRLFLFWGGRGASQLPGCEGGRGASQLWSWV